MTVILFYYTSPPVTSPSQSTTEKPGREAKEPQPPPQEYVILLADPDLLELPLEALKVFQIDSIASLTRDFSLQLFYHRFFQDSPQGLSTCLLLWFCVLPYRYCTCTRLSVDSCKWFDKIAGFFPGSLQL